MSRLPDWNLDPPEDDPEMDRAKRRYYKEPDLDDTDFDPPEDRDCDYWNRTT